MDQSKQAAYKNTLYFTTGIFVFLMCAATSSPALMKSNKSVTVQTDQVQTIPTIGRFIVTPTAARLVTPGQKLSGGQRNNNAE